jgi:hypothetical protein
MFYISKKIVKSINFMMKTVGRKCNRQRKLKWVPFYVKWLC